jgi:hypothetical protein
MNRIKWLAVVAIVLSMALWLVPSFVRDPLTPFPGYASYDDAHLCTQWHGRLLTQDSQVKEIRLLTPMNVLLSYAGCSLAALRWLGIFSSLAAALGVWLLLQRTMLPLRTRILAMALFGVSSLTMYLAAVPSSTTFVVGLSILAAGLAVQDSPYPRLLAALVAVPVAMSGPVPALNLAIILAGLSLWQQRARAALAYALWTVATGALVWWQITLAASFGWTLPVFGVLAEFGARPGVGIMEWLIAMIGIGIVWQTSTKRNALMFIAATVYASISSAATALAAPLWSALGAIAIVSLYERHWRYSFLRTLSLFAVGCGLLLSVLAVTSAIITAPPSPQIVEGIRSLAPDRTVLTYPAVADWVKWWSGAAVLYDDHPLTQKESVEHEVVLAQLWEERDLKNATRTMDSLGVDAVVVTQEMRKGLVWSADEEGLLFLLERSEMFKKVFSNDEIQVYYRIGSVQ